MSRLWLMVLVLSVLVLPPREGLAAEPLADGQSVKVLLTTAPAGANLLAPGRWQPWEKGFAREGAAFGCDNGPHPAQRGLYQTVELNQTTPQPIVAVAWSKAQDVGGQRDEDYSLYLDLTYTDGTPLWGQVAAFTVGTHDWERRTVTVLPEKPVKSVAFHMLLRHHSGQAWFKDAAVQEIKTPPGACIFDGVPVTAQPAGEGFQVRDVTANSGFLYIASAAAGLRLETRRTFGPGVTFIDATLQATTNTDRAVTLVYALPIPRAGGQWLANPRHDEKLLPGREYMLANPTPAGRGRLSRYPLAAISQGGRGTAIGIDMDHPALFRAGYNAATEELFLAYDLGLAPEKPQAHVRFCTFTFDPAWGFRAALARYYELFPEHFRCRTPQQGLWMPFAKISTLRHGEDFGFRFKEGNDETTWDNAHDILTFRYTEPLTWWMRMAEPGAAAQAAALASVGQKVTPPVRDVPRTYATARAAAQRLADEKHSTEAQAWATSVYADETGRPPARLLDEPWCHGAVWSMNSMPGIAGAVTDFKNKWNPQLRAALYGPSRHGELAGEYVDSSEGYVTDVLDFRRDHFSAADTPLTFAPETFHPAIFRGLIAFEYVRAMARDVHAMGKLMMANATPDSLCWLAPQLDVMGTEADWNPQGQWRPWSDEALLFRRALCRGKPYCFLMNTHFEKLPHSRVENYMQRCLAYGMFPGFFSADASTGAYFTRPELYERDRDLFKKYVPLCRQVAEAGWEPITHARSADARIHVERFGRRFLTVFNDSAVPRSAQITLEGSAATRELLTGQSLSAPAGTATLPLAAEGVAVLELH